MNQSNPRFVVKLTNGQIIFPNCTAFELKQHIQKQESNIQLENILIINNQNKIMTKAQLLQLQRLKTANQSQGDIILSIMNAQSIYDELNALKYINISQDEKIKNLQNQLQSIDNALNQQKNKVIEVENEKNERLQSAIFKGKTQQSELEQSLREHYEKELVLLNNEYSAKILVMEQKLKHNENLVQQAQICNKSKDDQLKGILMEKDKLQNSFLELDTKNIQLVKENEQLTQQLQQYVVGYTQLQNQFQVYQTQVNEYFYQFQMKTEQDYQKYTNEVEDLTQQKRKAVQEITEEKNWVKNKAAEYEEKYLALKKQFDKLQASNFDLNKIIEQQKTQVNELEQKLSELSLLPLKLEGKEKEIKRLKDQISQLLKGFSENINKQSNSIKTMSISQSMNFSQSVNEKKHNVQLSNGEIIKISASLLNLRKEIAKYEPKIPFEHLVVLNTNKNIKTVSDSQAINSENNQWQVFDAYQQNKEIIILKNKVQYLEQEVQSQLKIMDDLHSQIQNHLKENQDLQDFYNKQIQENNSKYELYLQQVQSQYEEQLNILKGDGSSQVQQLMIQYDEKVKALNGEISKFKGELEQFNKLTYDQKNQISELTAKLQNSISENKSLQQKYQELEQNLKKQEDYLNQYYQNQLTQQLGYIQDACNKQFQQFSQEAQKQVNDLLNQIAQKNERFETLRAEKQKLVIKIEDLENQIKNLERVQTSLQNQINRNNQKIQEQESEKKKLENEMYELKRAGIQQIRIPMNTSISQY